MDTQKERYEYRNYVGRLAGGKIRTVPTMPYLAEFNPPQTHYQAAESMAQTFMDSAQNPANEPDLDDFMAQKVELYSDKISLILNEGRARQSLKYDNLGRIYSDLFKVDQLRAEITFPQKYLQDRTWSDLNNMEFQLRSEIRRELKDSSRDTGFLGKDLRESLLEFKLQNQKSKMLGGGLEMGLDSPLEPETGDIHPPQNRL